MATSTSSLATATPSNERRKEQENGDRDAIMKWIDAITNDFPASNDEQQSSDTQGDATSFDSYRHLSLLDGGPGPVITCQFEDYEGDDFPFWLLNLHLKLRRVIEDRRIPQEVREKIDVEKHFANTPLDEVGCYFSSTKRSPLAKLDTDSEIKQVLAIVETAWDFDRLDCTNRDEWDAQVNGPMLELLEGYFEDFRIGAVQEQRAQPEYHPTYNGKQIEYKEQGINFAIVWTPTQDEEAQICSALGPGCSINHPTTDRSLVSQPMIIPIAAKMQQHYDNLDNACVPLVLWAMSQFKRLREISGRDWCSFPTPMLQVYGAQWHLLLAVDGPTLKVVSCGPIGSTTTLTQIYKLLGSLRVIMEWVSDTYLPRFKDEVLRRLVPMEYEEDSMDLS